MKRLAALLGMAMPLWGQYAGPAILSRGEAPAAMSSPDLTFRPFVDVSAVYSTGLSGVSVDSQGNIANQSSTGVEIAGGISGSHHWRHTSIGLSYRGDYNMYFRNGRYDTTDHSFLLGVTHQFSRHIFLSWSNSVGIINRDYGLLSTLSQTVQFDPSQTYVPTTDFFNNRTIFVSSAANVVIQKSVRLSFSLGGGLFTDIHNSPALYNVLGNTAYGDVQYRLSRRATIGGFYSYGHFRYSQLVSDSDIHSGAATFGYRLSRWWEFSGYGGFARLESKFIQDVPVDPAVAAIIGISESSEVYYSVRYVPTFAARMSRTFHTGVLSGTVSEGVTPGNGLFLTSRTTNVSVGYTYTGLRKWSFAATVNDQISKSVGNVTGGYGTLSAGINLSRHIAHGFHAVAGITLYSYNSDIFSKYNQFVYAAHAGIGWSPGDVPLRIW